MAINLTEQERLAINIFRQSKEYQVIMQFIKNKFEGYKNTLIFSKKDITELFQGKAQELKEIIDLFTK